MKKFVFLVVLIFLFLSGKGQNLIGYKSRDIQKYMTYNRKDLSSENVRNGRFNYLKYTDGSETQTLLFFLDKDSVCSGVRLICDSRVRAEKVREFNSTLQKKNDNQWVESRSGRGYLIELNDEEYSSIITIKPQD